MAGPKLWRPLPLSAPGIPSLLVHAEFGMQSYTIRITDLANVWEESLDKKPIIMRGLKEDTSIDPTDGPDQIRKLLDLLSAAFDPTSAEHGDTSLAFAGPVDKGNDNSVTIHISVILPGNLKPLKWPVYLRRLPRSAVATELVIPLIQAHHARAQEFAELATTLREKDSVITRLVDKLEAVGTGLEHVFTSLSGRRKATRAVAEDRIGGLRPFDEAKFRERSAAARGQAGPSDIPVLLDSVFGETGLACKAEFDIDDAPDLNDWWTKLGKGKHVALAERKRDPARKSGTPNPPLSHTRRKVADADDDNGVDGDDDDDDFQVQATPPHLKARQKHNTIIRPQPAIDDGDETSDGDDEDGALDKTTSSVRRTTHAGTDIKSSASGSRLGTIGKRAAKKPSPTPSPPRSPSPPPAAEAEKQALGDGGSDTASDVEDGEDGDAMDTTMSRTPSPKRAASPLPSSPQPRRAGLGRIGGRAKAPAHPQLASPEPSAKPEAGDGPSNAQTPNTPRRGKLGVIGRKATKADTGNEDRGRSNTPKEDHGRGPEREEQKARETSRERADRKRAELQSHLQKRAASGPAKKKRKF